jgi:hypothetical protein
MGDERESHKVMMRDDGDERVLPLMCDVTGPRSLTQSLFSSPPLLLSSSPAPRSSSRCSSRSLKITSSSLWTLLPECTGLPNTQIPQDRASGSRLFRLGVSVYRALIFLKIAPPT